MYYGRLVPVHPDVLEELSYLITGRYEGLGLA